MADREREASHAPKPPPKPKKPRRKKSDPKPGTVSAPVSSRPETSILQQYRAAKEKHPDMVLLFRIGDFYEAFAEDAETVHRTLGLTLTTRDQSIPMAGFPHHQLEAYLHKLLQAGLRVAICDQVEDSSAQRPVKREVHRVITPEKDRDTEGH